MIADVKATGELSPEHALAGCMVILRPGCTTSENEEDYDRWVGTHGEPTWESLAAWAKRLPGRIFRMLALIARN
jgi:hypothetical protein